MQVKFLLSYQDDFYSKLTGEHVSDDDYAHAERVWSVFKMVTLQDYHDLYLKTDVLLLADVFENFRQLALANYSLDPCHFITTPGLTMCAALKYTGVHLELLTSIDQLLFFEKGVRGGVSGIQNRHGRANNPLSPDFDPSKPTKYIAYKDMNNLYGAAMAEPLPVSGFRFLKPWEIKKLKSNIMKVADDAEIGYALEVDLDYPDRLHDAHNDYPLAPEHLDITPDMLSSHSKNLLKKLGKKPVKKNIKLVPNLMNKRKYVVHYRNLKFYIQHGMKLKKIHRVIEFKQARWLAPYINFNTEKRKLAATDFEKNLYKLCNNAVFGKTCENLRRRIDVRLISQQPKAERCIAKPTFDGFKIINEDITMVKCRKTSIMWRKPTYTGFAVLELSKLLMYKFHYEHIVPTYTPKNNPEDTRCRAKLLMTDTDSFMYEIETADVYEDMRKHSHLFDTSNYPVDHPNFSITNCKVVGKMKDECAGIPPIEFVGLRAKMYSLLLPDNKEKSTAKGIKRSHAQKHIRHSQYRDCLLNEGQTSETFHTIQSHNHVITTEKQTKSALSCYDDKRYLLPDTTDTLAYGHKDIKNKYSKLNK